MKSRSQKSEVGRRKNRSLAVTALIGVFYLSLVTGHSSLLFGQEEVPQRIRIEEFSWQLKNQTVRWSVTTGQSD